ncbi:MAG: O-antigen ligase family protein [Alphaproteobacteria bacterium]|nr:O-antigen ligase family protein [Alphaproteobacteria bacterium]
MTAPAASARASTPAIILAATGIVTPPLAVLAPLGVAPLLTLVAVALIGAAPRRLLAAGKPLLPLTTLWAALAVWAMLSAIWSVLPGHSLFEGGRFLVIGGEGLIALGAARSLGARDGWRVGAAAAIGIALGTALLLFEWATDAALVHWIHGWGQAVAVNFSRYDRGATTLVLILWPAVVALRRWRLLQAALAALVAVSVYLMPSAASLMALVAGVVAFAVALRFPRLIAATLAAGVAASAALLPVVVPSYETTVRLQHDAPWIKGSGIHRLLIWRFAAERIADRPLLGWGMDASRDLPGGRRDFAATLPGIELSPGHDAMPLHPHDALLQWRVELGIPGTLLGLAIVLWGLYRVGWRFGPPREAQAAALGWATTVLVIALLSFGIWQAWWLSDILLTASLLAASAADAG